MNPLEPGSARMIAQVDGSWDALDWSPDDKELLAQQPITGSTETHLWRVEVESGRGRSSPRGRQSGALVGRTVQRRRTAVYALSDRDSEVTSVWKGDLATGKWTPLTEEGVDRCVFRRAGRDTARVVADRGATSELQLIDGTAVKPRKCRRSRGRHLHCGVARPGTTLAIEFAGARTFRDVYAVDVKSGGSSAGRRARWAVRPGLAAGAEIVEWKSFDGRMIPGSSIVRRRASLGRVP